MWVENFDKITRHTTNISLPFGALFVSFLSFVDQLWILNPNGGLFGTKYFLPIKWGAKNFEKILKYTRKYPACTDIRLVGDIQLSSLHSTGKRNPSPKKRTSSCAISRVIVHKHRNYVPYTCGA